MHLFPRASIRKYHKAGWLKSTIYRLTVLEARIPTRCWHSHAPSEIHRKEILSCLFLASHGLLTRPGLLWQHFNLCLPHRMAFPPHVSPLLLLLYLSSNTSHIRLRAHPTLVGPQSSLIPWLHLQRFHFQAQSHSQVTGHARHLLEGHIWTHHTRQTLTKEREGWHKGADRALTMFTNVRRCPRWGQGQWDQLEAAAAVQVIQCCLEWRPWLWDKTKSTDLSNSWEVRLTGPPGVTRWGRQRQYIGFWLVKLIREG